MNKELKDFQRWYDKDPVVSRCVHTLENIENRRKRRTATFLTNEIILQDPYCAMLPEDLYELVMRERRTRRWYDFDEILKIFMELLKHCPDNTKREIAVKAMKFLEAEKDQENQS